MAENPSTGRRMTPVYTLDLKFETRCPPPAQVATALGAVMAAPAAKGLPCGVFGSFGWSGEAVDMMEGKLKVSKGALYVVDECLDRGVA